MQKFLALPTGGEAFLLRRGGVNILVDSGWKKDKLAKLLDTHAPDMEVIHIAVCTHADGDHAGGFMTLLDDWRPHDDDGQAPIRQFWLPGVWSEVVADLMQRPSDFFDSVLVEMKSYLKQGSNTDLKSVRNALDRILENSGEYPPRRDKTDTKRDIDPPYDSDIDYESLEDVSEPEWMDELRAGTKATMKKDPDDTEGNRAIRSVRGKIRYRIHKKQVSREVGKFWLLMIDTAEAIRKIAMSAIEHNVKIKWFDYGEFDRNGQAKGGVRGVLRPINAVEQRRPPLHTISKFCVLYLSEKNEQCLSFYSPALCLCSRSSPEPCCPPGVLNGCCCPPGVLFCGDSPMGNGSGYSNAFDLPPQLAVNSVIVTAPHHGSKSNEMAFDHICSQIAANRICWVRSGGNKNHPDRWYRDIPPEFRICTKCPHKNLPKKIAEVVHSSCWNPAIIHIGHRCDC